MPFVLSKRAHSEVQISAADIPSLNFNRMIQFLMFSLMWVEAATLRRLHSSSSKTDDAGGRGNGFHWGQRGFYLAGKLRVF